ncbi:MAG: hypothetical protein MPW17_12160 [Candidatus Manganitrophus sp.]|nr:MAG: hypothetical protein MPW17_12160 [Candidatus Manganitrophus sp.]
MQFERVFFHFGAVFFLLGIVFAGCSRGSGNLKSDASPSEVQVTLREWSVAVDRGTVRPGRITFQTANRGTEDHELVILRTDLPADALSLRDDRVDEATAGRILGEIEPFAPATEKELTLDLEPGSYVLLCNIVETENGQKEGHYTMGMRIAFKVESSRSRPSE